MNSPAMTSSPVSRPLRALAAALLVLATLPACSWTLGEQDMFRPHETAHVASTESELYIQGEDGIDAAVEHGFIDYNATGDRLAWTLVSRSTGTAKTRRPLVVMCGGNASDRYSGGIAYARKAIAHGDVLVFDYPGTGDTRGKATTANFEAAAQAIAGLAGEMAGDRAIVLWGHSLGGFVCADMASSLPQTAGVIFEASARNVDGIAEAWKPWYLFFIDLRVDDDLAGFDNVAALEGFSGPVLVLAGSRDRVLPAALSQALYDGLEAAGHDVAMATFSAGHNTLSLADGFDALIAQFFSVL